MGFAVSRLVGHLAVASTFDQLGRAHTLARRAAGLRRRGDLRRAAVVMREACYTEEGSPVLWVRYADLARLSGKRDQAERALKQALWLRERAGDRARALVIRRLLLRLGER
jgi:hypothetical protein